VNIAEFKLAPWANSHDTYKQSPLSLNPAPEYADSEVLIAGLYRTIGLKDVSEGKVPVNGRELDRLIVQNLKRSYKPEKAALDAEAFHGLLRSVLESPKRPNQSAKRFLQVSPIVGETALFSGSARLAGNPWPAGMLIRRMICMGVAGEAAAKAQWEDLFAALSVEKKEDVFAHFMTDELRAWLGESWESIVHPNDGNVLGIGFNDLVGRAFPARQFAADLKSMISAKPLMTRRQWIQWPYWQWFTARSRVFRAQGQSGVLPSIWRPMALPSTTGRLRRANWASSLECWALSSTAPMPRVACCWYRPLLLPTRWRKDKHDGLCFMARTYSFGTRG
jgi:hypothetical protein